MTSAADASADKASMPRVDNISILQMPGQGLCYSKHFMSQCLKQTFEHEAIRWHNVGRFLLHEADLINSIALADLLSLEILSSPQDTDL